VGWVLVLAVWVGLTGAVEPLTVVAGQVVVLRGVAESPGVAVEVVGPLVSLVGVE